MAGGGGFDEDEGIIAGINVTPLVDITLVLLIIFMVTTSYIVNPAIQVDLPKAATAEDAPTSTVSVVISRTGTVYLNGKETSVQGMGDEIRLRLREKPDLQVVIAADANATHGQVIHVIDQVKIFGVSKFAINTEPVTIPTAPPPADDPPDDTPASPVEVSP